jgi:hypothetical protein
MSFYERWLAGLSPDQEASYQRALSAERQVAAVQRQVPLGIKVSAVQRRAGRAQ